MLDPRDRGVLLEALRPPSGYVVDQALATTYSLDLIALLTAPLAFSLYDRLAGRDQNGKGEHLDSFALLQALRSHAERLVVFCEAGRIARPAEYRQLIAYLEDSVVPSRARADNGSFHPKVWVQRFTAPDLPVLYRVLVLSRNLTFDRSWDTILVLDGELQDRKLAIADSKPLAAFVAALPSFALAPLSPGRRAIVDTFADELQRVRFEVPDGFEGFRFWPIGIDDRKETKPFADTRIQRLLVVSPFVTASRLEMLGSKDHGKGHVLVSRLEELERIPAATLARFAEVHVLDDAADSFEEDDDAGLDEAEGGGRELPPARGLHAKLYVADDGAKAHVWTGSANASDAAFTANVELLVQLVGPKSRFGVEATLNGPAGSEGAGLRSLLQKFVPPEHPVVPTDEEIAVEELLRKANLAIARASWIAKVSAIEPAATPRETYTVSLQLAAGSLALPEACTVKVWPIALPPGRALPIDPSVSGASAVFERCSFQALTTFFAFELTPTAAPAKRCCFVVNVALEGAPEDRAARIVQTLLDDPAKVLRFLRLLLAVDPFEILDLLDPGTNKAQGAAGAAGAADDSIPLFESLVRTLDREPQRLVAVDRLIRELRSTPEGALLLPPRFDEVWTPLWAAYQSLPTEGAR